jgi:hypothetical protein
MLNTYIGPINVAAGLNQYVPFRVRFNARNVLQTVMWYGTKHDKNIPPPFDGIFRVSSQYNYYQM